MKKIEQPVLITGVLAGIIAALLTLGASSQPALASLLYAASALPVLVAGLGRGNTAAIVAIVTAAVLGAVAISPLFAMTMAIFTLIPAGWLSHLANLARPASEIGGPENLLAWYPLSDILLHLCGIITVAVIILGVIAGYGPELVGQVVDAMMVSVVLQQPSFVPDAAALAQTKALMLFMLPMIQGGMWVILLFAAYYFATRLVNAGGKSLRPREDIPSALRMNRNSIFIFLAGIVATFAGGVPALIGATVCGTFGAGFLMAGFASLHFRSRGKDWRLPVLVLAWLSTLFVLPLFIILIIGLSDVRRTIAVSPTGNTGDNA